MSWNPSKSRWALFPFEKLAANHRGRVTLLDPRNEARMAAGALPDDYNGPAEAVSVAVYQHCRRFATADPYPLIELRCEVTHFPYAALFVYELEWLPPMPEKRALSFLKKYDEWTARVFATECADAHFDLVRASVVTDGYGLAFFYEPEEAK